MKHVLNFKQTYIFGAALCLIAASFLSACNDDDPKREDTPELITQATLTFTPTTGSPVIATATDPDGEGIQDIEVDGPINLDLNKEYVLTIQLVNGLADPGDDEYNITAEVEEEGDEHMFFFGWTNNVFSDPAGNGNIDARADAVDYEDEDENGLPLGLTTSWTTAASAASGTFHVILKHQPDLKSATSTSATGESDLDITFTINVD